MCYTCKDRSFEAEEHRSSGPRSYLNPTSIVP
jgi:hypothetical protein